MSKAARTTRGSTNSRSPTAMAPAKPDSFRCTSSRECNPTAHGTTTAGSATRSSHSSPVLQSPPWPTPGGSPSGPASGEGCGQAEHPRGVRAWNTRDNSTVLVEELVSRGYVVATIDHTHDSSPVEFPDGRVEVSALPPNSPEAVAQAVVVRVADTHFVRDTLIALNAGSNPDAEHRPLPDGLCGALKLPTVGMFGHSLGGTTAAEAMFEDRRIKAGVNLDGGLFGPVVAAGLARPFMLVGNQEHGRDNDPTWAQFWANLRGWRLNLRLTGASHNSFTDIQALLPQAAGVLNLPPEVVQQQIGTIDPQRSIINQRAYVTAFFDLHLRHQDGRLLAHPSPRFPEMQFVP